MWRISSLPFFKRRNYRITLFILTFALWSMYFLPGMLEDTGLISIAHPLQLFSMNWLGVIFLIFVCLLLVDLITIFGLVMRKYRVASIKLGLSAGLLLALFAFFQAYRAPVVREYEVSLANLPPQYDGTILVALSDLHVGTFLGEGWLKNRISQANALKPDIIVLLGDFLEGDNPQERKKSVMNIFGELSAPLGVWGVTGNHESHGGLGSTVQFLEDSGVRMLRNEWVEIGPGLVLAGVDDSHNHFRTSDNSGAIEQALADRPSSCATIFLSHRPQNAKEIAADGVGLMLSGHTHGGQIWPFTYISALANPLLAGEYIIDGMPVLVSRGTGTWGPRMRLWYPGEILRVVLKSK